MALHGVFCFLMYFCTAASVNHYKVLHAFARLCQTSARGKSWTRPALTHLEVLRIEMRCFIRCEARARKFHASKEGRKCSTLFGSSASRPKEECTVQRVCRVCVAFCQTFWDVSQATAVQATVQPSSRAATICPVQLACRFDLSPQHFLQSLSFDGATQALSLIMYF